MRVEQDVLLVLSHAHTDGNMLRIADQLDRTLYERVNKVLEAAGGKWNRKAKAHTYAGDAAEAMEQVILTGHVVDAKSELGAFYTPPDLAADVIQLARINDGFTMKVLEPSAGEGALVREAVRAGAMVWANEINPETAKKAGQYLYPSGACMVGDFLKMEPVRNFDRVVMNPPFAKQADIHHVNHALQFVKAGGLLVAIMSAGVTFRDNKLTTAFRQLVEDRDGTITRNDEGAFRSSGTMVNTVTVTIPCP